MDPDHSLLLPYRISVVEVFDYQLAGFRSEFIRPSCFSFCATLFFPIYSVSNQMCYIKMNVAQATLASKASVVGWNSSEGAIFHTTNQIFIHLYSSCLTS